MKDSSIQLKKLSLSNRQVVLHTILEKYVDSNKKDIWLWDKFIQYEAINDDLAWSYIKDFIKDKECILFFNQEEEQEMFSIRSGMDLNYLLSETYGFEFYVTDRECTYLLCFSHHNVLYGCGTAAEWVKSLRSS